MSEIKHTDSYRTHKEYNGNDPVRTNRERAGEETLGPGESEIDGMGGA